MTQFFFWVKNSILNDTKKKLYIQIEEIGDIGIKVLKKLIIVQCKADRAGFKHFTPKAIPKTCAFASGGLFALAVHTFLSDNK